MTRSKNLSTANVYRSSSHTGVYCFRDVPVPPTNIVVTITDTLFVIPHIVLDAGNLNLYNCAQSGTQFAVHGVNPQTSSSTALNFFIAIN